MPCILAQPTTSALASCCGQCISGLTHTPSPSAVACDTPASSSNAPIHAHIISNDINSKAAKAPLSSTSPFPPVPGPRASRWQPSQQHEIAKSRMLRGAPYNAQDMTLVYERQRCEAACDRYNQALKNRLVVQPAGKMSIADYMTRGREVFVAGCRMGTTVNGRKTHGLVCGSSSAFILSDSDLRNHYVICYHWFKEQGIYDEATGDSHWYLRSHGANLSFE
jgi:hypothetical protein